MSHDSSLEPILRAVEPATRLVPERYLRQAVHYLADHGRPLPPNPNLPCWVPRAQLADDEVLPPHVLAGTEPELLLVTDPDDRLIDRLPRDEQLREYWRVLFQAAVMREIDRKAAAGELTAEGCRDRLDRFGPAAAREVRYVLEAEYLADANSDDLGRYRSFAAVYLDLETFGGHAVEVYFPSLPPAGEVRRVLGEDLDVAALLTRSRPPGAADPPREPPPDDRWVRTDTEIFSPIAGSGEPPGGLLGRAAEAERKGNNVRAAVLRTQAAAAATGGERARAESGATAALGRLVAALGDTFAWDAETREEWRQALTPLLTPASAGVWPRAARCLYELQKIPADLSREVYAVDLPEAIRTFGRRPVKRPLPRAKPVLVLMALKRAHTQLLRGALGHAARLRLDRLFHHQIRHLEADIRRDFTPVIAGVLTSSGFVPTNTVEEVARDKMVAELIDRVCDRGYLRIGDLRDAVARNRLKMGDLAGPGEFFRGDALLRADANLAYALDGVYRRGEVYLRGIQRFSSLFFGTFLGRLFTLYVALPFGGAFLTLTFTEHLWHKVVGLIHRPAATAKGPAAAPPAVAAAQPDVISADEVDVDDNGDLIFHEVSPDTLTSEEVEVDAFGDVVDRVQASPVATAVKELSPLRPPTRPPGEHATALTEWPVIVGFGVFLLFVFHSPPFRRAVLAALEYVWRGVRGLFWDAPTALWRSPWVRGFRQSRAVRFLARHFWSPLLITALVFGAFFLLGFPLRVLLRWGWLFWVALTLAYNTPWGWVAQDRFAAAVSSGWRVVRVNLVPGLLGFIVDLFRRLGNWIERQLYAVDEWLRYRGGDSQGSMWVKAALGLLWFPLAYVFRFAFYLLIEPQINPVKHFPVVTVSHKMLLPLVFSADPQSVLSPFGEVVAQQTGLAVAQANFWAFWIIAGIPGIFGFMAWEFLANWRLYAANRPARLRPVTLGSHGETMRGLLRPGFHSGTVPKLFRKMRHAGGPRADRLHHDLDHVAEAVHRFAERELVALLERVPEWGGLAVHVGAVHFGCQRLTIELTAPSLGRDPFVLAFENVGGRIEAAVVEAGWTDKLTEPQRAAFAAALRGLLDMAAAERVDGRERSDDTPPGPGPAELARRVGWAEWVARWSSTGKETGPDPRSP